MLCMMTALNVICSTKKEELVKGIVMLYFNAFDQFLFFDAALFTVGSAALAQGGPTLDPAACGKMVREGRLPEELQIRFSNDMMVRGR
jgi:hypothetical protein